MSNPFIKHEGAGWLQVPMVSVSILFFTLLLGYLIGVGGIGIAGALLLLPFGIVFFFFLIKKPEIGLYAIVFVSYILLGSSRYIELPFPSGVIMDALILLTLFAIYIVHFPSKPDWSIVKRDTVITGLIWFSYCIFQVVNPEAKSFAAWMSAIRPMGFYPFILPILAVYLLKTPDKVRVLLYIWGIMSLLGTLKGISQLYIGVDRWEQKWLDGGANLTHVLFGRLRVFSFYSDAGQFGGNQAYTGVIFIIASIGARTLKDRIFFLIVGIMGIYGMFLSGTRGSMAVPFAGFALFFLHRKNLTMIVVGALLGLVVFVFFKYTTIGQGNYQINRMRTAFNPEDASLQVRLENQKILKVYMATRPLGGGLGHGGGKAKKYLPYAFLSNVPTDSWYVLIWVELGVVGLIIHLIILFYILIKGSYYLMFRIRDKLIKSIMSGFACGMLGIMAASYGNAIIGQMPSGQSVYIAMGLMLNSVAMDKRERIRKRKATCKTKFRALQNKQKDYPRIEISYR